MKQPRFGRIIFIHLSNWVEFFALTFHGEGKTVVVNRNIDLYQSLTRPYFKVWLFFAFEVIFSSIFFLSFLNS